MIKTAIQTRSWNYKDIIDGVKNFKLIKNKKMIKAKKLKLQKFLPIGLIKKPGKHVSLKKNFIGSKETILLEGVNFCC